jgi:DNA-binding response OmpR family regulator
MDADSAPPILIYVEDEPLTQDLVKTALQDAGYEVLTADDGAGGLELIRANEGDLRGLVTDIDLGAGPDGWAIAGNAREAAGGLAVVYVSGASAHDWASKGVSNSVMIAKPFAPAQIVVAISSLLFASDKTSDES